MQIIHVKIGHTVEVLCLRGARWIDWRNTFSVFGGGEWNCHLRFLFNFTIMLICLVETTLELSILWFQSHKRFESYTAEAANVAQESARFHFESCITETIDWWGCRSPAGPLFDDISSNPVCGQQNGDTQTTLQHWRSWTVNLFRWHDLQNVKMFSASIPLQTLSVDQPTFLLQSDLSERPWPHQKGHWGSAREKWRVTFFCKSDVLKLHNQTTKGQFSSICI